MPIYTRTGDRGKTSLGSGIRVYKFARRIEAIGMVDELNALVGVVIAELSEGRKKPYKKDLIKTLLSLQNDLFCIGAYLANDDQQLLVEELSDHTLLHEQEIDQMSASTPALTNFILPGGEKSASFLHLARTVCRRAERTLVQLSQKEKVDQSVVKYINRTSDLLFAMARFVNFKEKKKDIIWKSNK